MTVSSLALIVLVLLAAVWFVPSLQIGQNLSANCQVNGFGSGQCQFTNTGWTPGTQCVVVKLSNTHGGSAASGPVCSGAVWPNDSVSKLVSFSIGDVCNDGDGNTDLSGSCTMDIVDGNADEHLNGSDAPPSTSSASATERFSANSTTAISADNNFATSSAIDTYSGQARASTAATAATSPLDAALPDGVTAVAKVAEPSTSMFAQYSDSLYTGSPVSPDFNGNQRKYREYRTMLLNGIKRGVNFGGYYSIVTFGCGTECLMGYIVDLRTGDVYDLPLVGTDNPDLNVAAKPNSSLLIERYRIFDPKSVRYVACEQDVAAWENGRAKWLSKTRMPLGTDAGGNDEQCPDYSPNVGEPLSGELLPSSATTVVGRAGDH
jgi:hypothetical protein